LVKYYEQRSEINTGTPTPVERLSVTKSAPKTAAPRPKYTPSKDGNFLNALNPSRNPSHPKDPIADFFLDSINFKDWPPQNKIMAYLTDLDEASDPGFKISWSAELQPYRLIYILTSIPPGDSLSSEPNLYFYFQLQSFNDETGGLISLAAQSGRIESLKIKNDRFWITSPIFSEPLLHDFSQLVASVPTLEETNGELRYLDKTLNELTPPLSFQWSMDSRDFDPWNW
jgi:hypothetical protein